MSKEQIISKGKYTRTQPNDMVGVKQYLFVRDEDGKKRLLLRFANNRCERCSKFAFILYRLDAKGNVLGQDKYESADKEFAPNGVFSFDRRIEVEEKCSDFKVQMVYARYGSYTYNVEHENVSVAYSERNKEALENAARTSKVKPRKIHTRRFDMPWLFGIISVIMLSLVVFACGFLLNAFMEREVDFTLSGVDYRFVDKEKKDDIIIMGCADTYREITLTGEIEGHKVVGIDNDAFEGNKNLVKINIDGLNIPERAFEDCRRLEVLTIKNVTEIGERAFEGCSSLESITVTEGKVGQVITVGKRAFADCKSLKTVEINQTVAYGQDVDYFYKSKNIESLKLKSIAYTDKKVESAYVTRLAALFGEENNDNPSLKLESLTVEKMDAIPERFVYGFKKLKSVTVSGTEIKTVGASAFENCAALDTLSLKGKLTTVGSYTFANTNIETLDMSKVSSLGQGVFKNNDKLTSVKGFGEGGIDNVPKGTFEGCVALKSFTFHKNIKHVFTEAFKGSGLTKITIPAGVSYDAGILKDCKKLATLEVYEFGSAGFIGQLFGADRGLSSDEMAGYISNALTTITLGSGTEINESAFKGCKNVTTINLPVDIVSIGANAFSGCKKLTVVDIPSDSQTLKTIGDRAFYKCEKLKYVPLLDSLERIGESALEGCNSIESIALPFLGATPALDDEDETVSYVFGGFIPASLKEIALLDSSVVSIPDGAFEGCTGVKKVTIPNNASSIGASAFAGCTALTTVALSDGTSADIGADLKNVVTVGAGAFDGCAALSTVTMSDKLDIIGAYAFADTGILKITIPSSVTYIGEGILANCTKIGSAELPYLGATKSENGRLGYFFENGIPTTLKAVKVGYFDGGIIGADAFSGARNVSSIGLPADLSGIGEGAFKNCESLNSFSFGDITTVGDTAFYGCTSLKDIDLSRVVSIGSGAFYGCESVTRVDLASVSVIDDNAFDACTSLALVNLGQDTRVIGKSAFYGTAIKNIEIPEGVESLSDYAFGTCKSLSSVKLPSTLTHIYDGVFMDTAITEISIPDGVKYVGGFAFKNTGITSLRLPATLEYLGYNAIVGCEAIKSVELPFTDEMSGWSVSSYLCGGNFPSSLKSFTVNGSSYGYIQSGAFAYSYYLEEIIIDADIYDVYWNAFSECRELRYLSLPRTLEYVEDGAFSSCYRLYEISNPSGVDLWCEYTIAITPSFEYRAQTVEKDGCKFANMGGQWYLVNYPDGGEVTIEAIPGVVDAYIVAPYLFYGNNEINKVVFKSGAEAIGNSALAECQGLTEVNFADTVTSIDSDALAFCYSLKKVVMPTSLVRIGDGAFRYCNSMNGIKLYGNVKSIGENAFLGCTNLYDVYNTSTLKLTAGSKDYGYVARRAVKVHTDMNEAISVEKEVSGIGTFRCSGNDWLLISGSGENTVVLGEFTCDGVNVKSYRIAEYAFEYRYGLEKLTITNAVKQIQTGAFNYCAGLKYVDCSDNASLTELEDEAFANCYNLVGISMPTGLRIIGSGAFYGCTRLHSIQLPVALEVIGTNAFYGCERIISVTLHQSVKEIGENAFLGCNYLFEVYDLSPYVTVSAGSRDNGYVAMNAYAVYTSVDSALERREQNGVKLIYTGSTWYLYDFEDKGQAVLEIPNLGSNLIIMPYSIVNGAFEGIVMPMNLTEIKYNAIVNCHSFGSIYYMGDSSEWYEVEGAYDFSGFQDVYYKEDCVHYYSYFAWTWDENHSVTTACCPEASKITMEPTCYENGQVVYSCQCNGCDYTRREAIDKLDHSFDKDGVCKNCGETKTKITGDNLKDYVESGVISIDGFSYDSSRDCLVSTNKEGGSTSAITVVAKGRMTVSFTIEASSLMFYDYVCVYENGARCEMVSGKESASVTLQLDADDVVVITYEKDYGGSQNNDCGYVKNLQIVEMKEQQSN